LEQGAQVLMFPELSITGYEPELATAPDDPEGRFDDFRGGTAVIGREGQLQRQLNDTDEGVLILDTDTEEAVEKIL